MISSSIGLSGGLDYLSELKFISERGGSVGGGGGGGMEEGGMIIGGGGGEGIRENGGNGGESSSINSGKGGGGFCGGVPNWVCCLEEELDRKLIVVLRDGRKMIGFLRTFDQFGNLMLEDCHQRIIVDLNYADIYLGSLIIRGENIVLFGAVDEGRPSPLRIRPLHEIMEMQKVEEEKEKKKLECLSKRARLMRQEAMLLEEW